MPRLPRFRRRRSFIRRPTRRQARRRLVVVSVLAVVLLVVAVAAADNLLHRGRVLRHVSVAGVDVSGTRDDALRETLRDLEPRLEDLPVELTSGDRTITTTARESGLRIDIEATVKSARRAGHRGVLSPLAWYGGFLRAHRAALRLQVDHAVLAAAVIAFTTPRDERVRFETRDGRLVAWGGDAGTTVDAPAVGRALLASAAKGDNPIRAEVNATPGTPRFTDDQLRTLADTANRATEGGMQLTVATLTRPVDERTVRSWLRPTADASAFVVDAAAAGADLARLFPDVGGPGSDAVIAVVDGAISLTGGDPTTACCAADSADRIVTSLRAGVHTAELALAATPRPRGKEWADQLGIHELVGEFTTRYPSGQPRVTNIKRIAELTRGAVIEPGKTFSVNEFIGPRTVEKGFVSAGVIQNGVFQEDVGGGISQYATTLFNAAFFAGLDYADYQSHSIYISRYPYGREATLSYPAPDLKLVNTAPFGVMIWATATNTSVTVQLWSTKFAHGEQTAQSTRPQGAACTRVSTERTRTYVDGRPPKIDSVSAVYRPEGVDCNGNPSAPSVTALPPTTTVAPTTSTTAPPPTTAPPTTTAPPPTTTASPPPTTTAPPPTTTMTAGG